jgi:hypothetical protein
MYGHPLLLSVFSFLILFIYLCLFYLYIFFLLLLLLDAAPTLSIAEATVGVQQTSTLTLTSPVIQELTITLSTTPASNPVDLSPSVFNLYPPGLNAGTQTYSFYWTPSNVGTIVFQAALSGPDAPLFPAIPNTVVNVGSGILSFLYLFVF